MWSYGERVRGSLGVSFIRAPVPFMGPPKALPPTAIAFEVRIPTQELGGGGMALRKVADHPCLSFSSVNRRVMLSAS